MQTLERYIQNIRNHHLNIYLDAVAAFRRQHSQTEVEALASSPAPAGMPAIFAWRRFDFADRSQEPPRAANFNPDTHVSFPPESFTWQKKLKIRLEPLAWNNVEFECADFAWRESLLVNWAERWLDPNNKMPTDNHGLGGRIHAVTQPQKKVNKTVFFVDFGSAPAKAVFELLNVLALAEVKKVRIRTAAFRADAFRTDLSPAENSPAENGPAENA